MSFTLQQTITFVKNQMGEAIGTPGGFDPIDYQTLVQMAADEVAQDTDCYTDTSTIDTVASQALYAAPQKLYKIAEAMFTGGDLQQYRLQETTYQEMNDRYAGWQNSPPGTPYWFITEGLNQIILSPAPSVSSLVFNYTDLVISGSSQFQVSSAGQRAFVSNDVGYVILVTGGTGFNTGRYTILSVTAGVATVDQPIGTVSSTGGVGEITSGGLLLRGLALPSYNWTSLSQVNPMALPAHRAVAWRTCLLRLNQFPTKDNMLRETRLTMEYEKAKGQLAKSVTQYTAATRRGVRRKFPFSGGYGG